MSITALFQFFGPMSHLSTWGRQTWLPIYCCHWAEKVLCGTDTLSMLFCSRSTRLLKWNCFNQRHIHDAVSVPTDRRWCFELNISHVLSLQPDSAQRSAVIECSDGFGHMHRDFSWGDDSLSGTALSQTSSISALRPPCEPGSRSFSFRGALHTKVWHIVRK